MAGHSGRPGASSNGRIHDLRGPEETASLPGVTPSTEPVDWLQVTVPARQALYRAGQLADRILVVSSGIVEAVVTLPNGRLRILGLHGPGAVLGMGLASGLHQHGRYPHTALAIREVEARWVFATTLQRLRRTSPADYLELLEGQCAELRRAERWIAEFAADSATSRLARLIAYLAELEGGDAERCVELLTCREMGEAVGVSAETASRALADFKRTGLLERDGTGARNRYRFDPAALQRVAFP